MSSVTGGPAAPETLAGNRTLIWTAALSVAALGTWMMFDAMPGINWLIWTACAAGGLILFLRTPADQRGIVLWLEAASVVIAGAAAVTADQFLTALICLSVIVLLALSMLLSVDPRLERITPGFTVVAPAAAFGLALAESVHRLVDALHLVRSSRVRAIVRGLAITLPVVVIFGLLLSSADPTFADWRDAIGDLLSSWAFLPRAIFFCGLLTIVLGAYGYTERGNGKELSGVVIMPADGSTRNRWLGSTERLILLAGVSLLFWTFLAVQLSYLFGNFPSIRGSGMTFAEYARRGFAELTVVASCSVFLIIIAERYGEIDQRQSVLRAVTLSVVLGVLFLLGSAFHRVVLYEQAYGFTTARLYAQAYMIVVAVSLLILAREVTVEVDPSRLFRRTGAAAILTFIVLIYWNHEAWIADRNIDLFATTGKLDMVYLTSDLSGDAIPTILRRLPSLPEPARTQLSNAVKARYRHPHTDEWFEWNLRRSRARDALVGL